MIKVSFFLRTLKMDHASYKIVHIVLKFYIYLSLHLS